MKCLRGELQSMEAYNNVQWFVSSFRGPSKQWHWAAVMKWRISSSSLLSLLSLSTGSAPQLTHTYSQIRESWKVVGGNHGENLVSQKPCKRKTGKVHSLSQRFLRIFTRHWFKVFRWSSVIMMITQICISTDLNLVLKNQWNYNNTIANQTPCMISSPRLSKDKNKCNFQLADYRFL